MLKLSVNTTSKAPGPEEIIDAVYGNAPVYDTDEAVMGRPTMEDFGSEYVNDYHIVVPLLVTADVDLAPFVFELPESPELDGGIEELAGFYGIEKIEEIGGLEGQIVPLEWPDGYPQPALNVLRAEVDE